MPKVLLDTPCGSGELAEFLRSNFPQLKVIGVDIARQPSVNFEFHEMDTHSYIRNVPAESLDIITCISGVMVFDFNKELISCFHRALKPEGLLIVTNDNIMTVRDRLNFLIFGHFKRFKLIYSEDEANWNVLLPQAVSMLLRKNKFKNIHFKYTMFYIEDWFLIPVALIIYPIFLLYMLSLKSELNAYQRLNLFPFKCLLARHYVVVARK